MVASLTFAVACAPTETMTASPVTVWTTNQLEVKTKALLAQLLAKYDLSDYFFTDQVVVTYDTNPRSHPVITLHTRYHDAPDRLLALFIHEQLHWYLESKQTAVDLAKQELEALFPEVPSGIPNGGGFNEDSTYLHLILCTLELHAARRFVGDERALAMFREPNIYDWIYATVLENQQSIGRILENHALAIESSSTSSIQGQLPESG